MKSTKIIHLLGLTAAVIFISFCGDNSTHPIDIDWKIYREPREVWNAHNIKNYTITEKVICFCPNASIDHELFVSNGEIDFIKNSDTNELLTGHSKELFKTIDELFDFLETIDPDSVADFEVEYHERYGYPVKLFIDYNEMMIDEEIGYELKDLKLE